MSLCVAVNWTLRIGLDWSLTALAHSLVFDVLQRIPLSRSVWGVARVWRCFLGDIAFSFGEQFFMHPCVKANDARGRFQVSVYLGKLPRLGLSLGSAGAFGVMGCFCCFSMSGGHPSARHWDPDRVGGKK